MRLWPPVAISKPDNNSEKLIYAVADIDAMKARAARRKHEADVEIADEHPNGMKRQELSIGLGGDRLSALGSPESRAQVALFVLCVRRYCGPAMVRLNRHPNPASPRVGADTAVLLGLRARPIRKPSRERKECGTVPGREMSIDRGRFGTNSQRLVHLGSFRRVA